MSVTESQARIKARIWQAVAQSNLDLQSIPKETVDNLIDLVTEAAILELDDQMETIMPSQIVAQTSSGDDDDVEVILWEGRPFLSIGKRYVITNERVRIIDGVIGKSKEDVELIRIQDIDQTQRLTERLFKLGDLTIRSRDASQPVILLNNIKDPERVHEILRRAVLKARQKYQLGYREEM
ncbi:MAG: PH domain-containing protein [Anaerolineales bacterium]|nr:PH domain-containing protein [Anaerolineales bacterium]